VFGHAPTSFRVKRLVSVYNDLTEAKARALITDSECIARFNFNEMTGHHWICAKNYNLSIDTSLQALDDIAELIIDLAAKQRQVAPATG